MLRVHLSFKPPNYWRILFWSGGIPRQFSYLKKSMTLVVPGEGFHRGIIIQVILTPRGVLLNGKLCLIRKGYVKGAPIHAPRYRNSPYGQMVRQSININR